MMKECDIDEKPAQTNWESSNLTKPALLEKTGYPLEDMARECGYIHVAPVQLSPFPRHRRIA